MATDQAAGPSSVIDERYKVVRVGGIGNHEDQGAVVLEIKKLYKQHVDNHVRVEDLDVEMYENDGYALIKCTTADLALRAVQQLNGKLLKGKQMAVSFFYPQPSSRRDKRFNVVRVGGIGNGEDQNIVVREADIKKLYEQHVNKHVNHRDLEVKMYGKDGYALIKCPDERSALKAVERLNKKPLLKGGKQIMEVSLFYPEREAGYVRYTIGDQNGYRKFIEELREMLCSEYIEYDDDKGKHVKKPVLPGQQRKKQPEWIHIDITAKEGTRTSSTTLVMRTDNLYVKGFKNHEEKWFEFCEPEKKDEKSQKEKNDEEKSQQEKKDKENSNLPAEYDAEKLVFNSESDNTSTDVIYSSILGLSDAQQVKRTLKTTRLGKALAERAVGRLSSYQNNMNNDNTVRLGLAGLIVMICEAARTDPFLQHLEGAWDQGMGLKEEKLFVCMWYWGAMSAALRKRNFNPYRQWDCGVATPEQAIDYVHLVLNSSEVKQARPGGAWVEILDVSVGNFPVHEINLIINEEQKSSITIYSENDEPVEDKKMTSLKLIATDKKCISVHKWLTMEVVVKPGISKEFKWDCRKQPGGYASTESMTCTIDDLNSGSGGSGSKTIKVTYLVMSEAVKATVGVVSLWLKDEKPQGLPNEVGERGDTAATATATEDTTQGNKDGGGSKQEYTAYGKITARIGGFEGYPIVLFERSEMEAIPLKSALIFDRSTIYVPEDKQLQIDMNGLVITETSSSNGQLEHPKPKVVEKPCSNQDCYKMSFPCGDWTSQKTPNDSKYKFQGDVAWAMPYVPEPNARFTIGDDKDLFTKFIVDEVRKVFGKKFELSDKALHNYAKVCQDAIAKQELQPSEAIKGKLFLTGPRPPKGQPDECMGGGATAPDAMKCKIHNPFSQAPPQDQWFHIELQVEADNKQRLSTTLAVQGGKCYGVGFMNQSKVWYDLGCGNQHRDKALPQKYNSVLLGWGLAYFDILDVQADRGWGVLKKLNEAGLGTKSFAEKAVRTLSHYPDVDDYDLNPRVAVAGLILMVCESARYRGRTEEGENCEKCDRETGFSWQLMYYIWSWGKISRALLHWHDNGEWPYEDKQTKILKQRGITEGVALNSVRLVYGDARTLQFHLTASGSTTKDLGGE
ncbi:unnamed protein product [Urochloa humidicola]